MCVLLFDLFNQCSLIQLREKIYKWSNVNVKHLLLRKSDVLKLRFSRKENLKKCTTFEELKGTRYIRENVYFGIIVFSCLSSTKPCLRFLLICFALDVKGFFKSSLGNEVNFTDIMNVSSNFLAKNRNFKKLRNCFVDERAMITTRLTSSCHWETLVHFCLGKKRSEKAVLILAVNYRKIVHRNKLCHSKQQQIGFLIMYDVI